MIWVRRGVFFAIALVATLIAFQFWGKFSGAMHDAMKHEAAQPAPANTGEVTVGIIQPKQPPMISGDMPIYTAPPCDKKKHHCK